MFWGLESPLDVATASGLDIEDSDGGASEKLCSSRGGIALSFDNDFEPLPGDFPLPILDYGSPCLSDAISGLEDLPGDPWEVAQALELNPKDGFVSGAERRDAITPDLQTAYVQELTAPCNHYPENLQALLLDTSSRNGAVDTSVAPYNQAELDDLSCAASEASVTDTALLREPERLCLSDLEETDGSEIGFRPRAFRRPPMNQASKRALVKHITIEFLEDHGILDIPLQEACRTLGVTHSLFKRRLRELGIKKWPSRKRNSLRALLKSAEDLDGPICGLDGDLAHLRDVLQAEIKSIRGNTCNWSAIKRFRQTMFKHRCLQKKAQQECLPPPTPPPRRPGRLRGQATVVESQNFDDLAAMEGPPSKRTRIIDPASPPSSPAAASMDVTWGAHKSRLTNRRARSAST